MSWSAVGLVARREIVQRVRERSFQISTVVTLVIVAGILLIGELVGGSGDEKVKVAASGPGAAAVVATARRGGPALELDVRPRRVADDAAARRLVAAGDVDLALLRDGREILRADGASDDGVALLQAASREVRAVAALRALKVSGAQAVRVLQPPPLAVRSAGDANDQAKGIAFVVLLLLYGQLLTYGLWVAYGVVEEKATRIVEILLATIRPVELLVGKILGVGFVALVQLLAVSAGGLTLGAATGQLDIGADQIGAVAVALAFFLLGYGLYACAFAIAGALVPRQEEVQNVTAPITICIIGSFFLAFSAVDDPSSSLATALSFVPMSAPLVMPVRVIAGEVGALEVAASVAVVLLAAGLLVALAARIYGAAVLQTGRRIGLRAAWRQASA